MKCLHVRKRKGYMIVIVERFEALTRNTNKQGFLVGIPFFCKQIVRLAITVARYYCAIFARKSRKTLNPENSDLPEK